MDGFSFHEGAAAAPAADVETPSCTIVPHPRLAVGMARVRVTVRQFDEQLIATLQRMAGVLGGRLPDGSHAVTGRLGLAITLIEEEFRMCDPLSAKGVETRRIAACLIEEVANCLDRIDKASDGWKIH